MLSRTNIFAEKDFLLETNRKKSGVLETSRQKYLGYSFHFDEKTGTVTAFRTKRTRDEAYRDWHQGHIERVDRHYHIVSDGILSKKDYNLLFENEEGAHHIPVETMGALNIYSDVVFSSDFFRFAASKHLYVSIFDRRGNMAGSFLPADNGYRSKTMLKQAGIYLDTSKRLAVAKEIESGAGSELCLSKTYSPASA